MSSSVREEERSNGAESRRESETTPRGVALVYLRRLTEDDLEYLYKWENDPAVWPYGDCGAAPFTSTPGKPREGCVTAEYNTGNVQPERETECFTGNVRPEHEKIFEGGERFSRLELMQFIENQHHDIYETEQIRFVICLNITVEGPIEETIRPPHAPCATSPSRCVTDRVPDAIGANVAYGAGAPIGFIDLFDYDEASHSAGVGIIICDERDRGKGYGGEAVRLLVEHARHELGLRTLWCDVAANNGTSRALFNTAGFNEVSRISYGTMRLSLHM